MEFNKDHKLKWELITQREAMVFIDFLLIERDRHEEEAARAKERIHLISFSPVWKDKEIAWKELLASQEIRHEEDIKEIDQLIIQVKHWFEL